MLGTLLAWFVYAVFIKLAVGIATDVNPRANSLGRAFATAAVLSIGQGLAVHLGATFLLVVWPIVWLFILKHMYEIGWGRAILVWIALVALAIALVFFVLVPLGLMSALTLGLLHF